MAKMQPPYETLTGIGRVPLKLTRRATVFVAVMTFSVMGLVIGAPGSLVTLYGLLALIGLGVVLAAIFVPAGIRRCNTWLDFERPAHVDLIKHYQVDNEYAPGSTGEVTVRTTRFTQVALDGDSTLWTVEEGTVPVTAGDYIAGQVYREGYRIRHLKKVA